ncbi:alpha/beta hydrolase [Agromyces sp. NPDC058484]|uniref:alpha/beta hydrolase n=1 Tax=Agromyces sp. NPDC058484 TaxID=3346524 RepID=UPI003653AEAA
MDVLRLVLSDLAEIRQDLRAAMGARYPEFERRLRVLIGELERDPTRFPPREVRALIDEYLTREVAQPIIGRTLTLAGDAGARGPAPELPPPPEAALSKWDFPAEAAPPPPSRGRGWNLPDLFSRRSRRRDRIRLEIPEGPGVEMAPAKTTYVTVPVWYATDRRHLPWEAPRRRYGADMSIVDDRTVMNYGTVDVSIPKTHEIGRLESPKWYLLEWRADPEWHIVVQGVTELDEQAWLSSIRNRVAGPVDDGDLPATDTSRDILIFIHGYRTSWAESVRRAAQFAYDLNFQGLPMLYSWPSRGDLLSYTADESASAWSAPHFTAVLKRVLAEGGARRVHLVAHSMGNRVSTEALKVLALEKPDYPTPVREVVFAAPDIDRHTFQEFVTAFNAAVADFEAPRMPRLTLYACGVDSALDLSRRVHRLNRAGDSRRGIVVALPMDTIEVARRVIRRESRDSIGHSYFCSNSVVIADLVGVVLDGRTPTERVGLTPRTTRGGPYWRLVGAGAGRGIR